MVPGRFVMIRYRSTQRGSVPETEWRCLLVKRLGLVRETEMGHDDDMCLGWWCEGAMGVGFLGQMKFFLKCRILEVLGDDHYE